jgi:heat shock protein HslJ
VKYLVGAVALSVLLAGCGDSRPYVEPVAPTGSFVAVAAADGGRPRDLVGTVSVTFGEGYSFGYNPGCNTRFGTVLLGGGRVHAKIHAVNMMGCSGAVDAQEDWVEEFFDAAPRYSVDGAMLTLRTDLASIEFAPREDPGQAGAPTAAGA